MSPYFDKALALWSCTSTSLIPATGGKDLVQRGGTLLRLKLVLSNCYLQVLTKLTAPGLLLCLLRSQGLGSKLCLYHPWAFALMMSPLGPVLPYA